jgi:hypothetical protein
MGRTAVAVATAAVFIALAAYAWRGTYTRYFRDDYVSAQAGIRHGPIGVVLDLRRTWSGRFSYFFLKAHFEKAGPWTPPFVPGLTLAVFVAAGVRTLRRALDAPLAPALLTSAAMVFATVHGAPKVLAFDGPLMSESGALTYVLPLILFVLWLGLFAPGERWRVRTAAGTLLMLFAGGLSETSLATQGAITGGALLACLILRDRQRAILAAFGFAATLAALAIVGSAPGNAVRSGMSSGPLPLPEAILETLRIAMYFLGAQTLPYGWSLLLVLVGGSLLGSLSPRLRVEAAVAAGLIALAAYLASFLPSVWILANVPPDRALLVSNFCLVMATGAFAAAFNRRRAARAGRDLRTDYAALLLLSVIPLVGAVAPLRDIPRARIAVAESERIGRILTASRGGDVIIRSPWALDNGFASAWRTEDVNVWLCRYYGARTLQIVR